MLSRPGPVPQGDYAYEVKWDGFRAMVSTVDGLRVRSRRGWNTDAAASGAHAARKAPASARSRAGGPPPPWCNALTRPQPEQVQHGRRLGGDLAFARGARSRPP